MNNSYVWVCVQFVYISWPRVSMSTAAVQTWRPQILVAQDPRCQIDAPPAWQPDRGRGRLRWSDGDSWQLPEEPSPPLCVSLDKQPVYCSSIGFCINQNFVCARQSISQDWPFRVCTCPFLPVQFLWNPVNLVRKGQLLLKLGQNYPCIQPDCPSKSRVHGWLANTLWATIVDCK